MFFSTADATPPTTRHHLAARFLVVLSWLLALTPATLHAESMKRFGAYQVHYSAFHSTDIAADAVQAHHLRRTPNIGMLNITVLKHHPDGQITPESAVITLESTNLVGQTKNLDLKTIQEPGALYYIAQFRFANEETFRFHLTIIPDSDPSQRFTLKFTQKFYGAAS